MTDKTYWLVDATGRKALVAGAAERDRWLPLGWADTTEPAGDELVFARAPGVEQPGVFPASALATVWAPKGWAPGAPPAPASPSSGPTPEPEPPAPTAKPATPAAGGSTREK
jgi:hypothetical protein